MSEKKTFLCTRFEPDGWYSEKLEAHSWEEAERLAEEEGWRVDGELVEEIPAEDISVEEAMEIVVAMNEKQYATVH